MIGTLEERFWAKVKKTSKCWLWLSTVNDKGYGFIGFRKKLISAHRYSYSLHNGEIPSGMHVLHHCDNPSCVNPKHLWIGTNYDNVQDKMRKGRDYDKRNAKNPNAKLTLDLADEIRLLYEKGGYTQPQLGRKYGVNRNVIGRIVNNQQWIR